MGAVEGMIKESESNSNSCGLCGVPVFLHGTCCGWINAIAPAQLLDNKVIIIDKRHPGFGQDLDEWKRNELKKN